jgi:hypothetical protein
MPTGKPQKNICAVIKQASESVVFVNARRTFFHTPGSLHLIFWRDNMKQLISLVVLGFALAAGAAHAADDGKTKQQEKMATCNADAKTKALKGDERKAFMKSCLSNKPAEAAAPAATNQQGKMKTCNADAKTKALKGDDRKKFMSECLSAK